MGLESLYNYYNSVNDVEHKTMVVSGINQAIYEYGYGKFLISRDLYHIQMIIQNTLEFLRNLEKEGDHLFAKLCRLIYFVRSDTYTDELLTMMKKYTVTLESLRILVSLNRGSSIIFLNGVLTGYMQEPLQYSWHFL